MPYALPARAWSPNAVLCILSLKIACLYKPLQTRSHIIHFLLSDMKSGNFLQNINLCGEL